MLHGDAAAYALVGRLEVEVDGVALPVFQVAKHGVVAEFVAAFHELVRLYGKSLLFAEAALGIEGLCSLGKRFLQSAG